MPWLDRFFNALGPSAANGGIAGVNTYVFLRAFNELSKPTVVGHEASDLGLLMAVNGVIYIANTAVAIQTSQQSKTGTAVGMALGTTLGFIVSGVGDIMLTEQLSSENIQDRENGKIELVLDRDPLENMATYDAT